MNPIVNNQLPLILDKLRQYAFKLTKNNDKAEELVQDTIIKILEKQDLYHQDLYFSTWSTTIMRNLFIDNIRKNKKKRLIYNYPDSILNEIKAEELEESEVNADNIFKFLDELKDNEKQLVLDKLEKSLTYKQLGELYGMEPNLIRNKYIVVINKLRRIIKKKILQ